MRIFALEDIANNPDSFGNGGGKNMYAYKPPAESWRLLLWDLDVGQGDGSITCGPELTSQQPLFYGYDTVVSNLNSHPPFLRAYWRGIQDAVNGPMLSANIGPILDANYSALSANGIPVASPDALGAGCSSNYTLRSWIATRRTVLTNELAKLVAPFEISNNNGNNFAVTNQINIALIGKAPVEVASIWVTNLIAGTTNAILSWSTLTNWSATVSLPIGTNTLSAQGFDRLSNLIPGAFDSITITNKP